MREEDIVLLTSEDQENDAPYEVSPDTIARNFTDDKEAMEDQIYRTLMAVMLDPEAKQEARVKAAVEAAELIGLKGKGSTTNVFAQNAQVNQLSENPEVKKALSVIGSNFRKVSGAIDSGVRTAKGGEGA